VHPHTLLAGIKIPDRRLGHGKGLTKHSAGFRHILAAGRFLT
jgi:hypothetical protein